MTNDLKPCPFCGGDPEMDTLRAYRNISTGGLGDGVAVYCTACSADMMMCRADHPGMEIEDMIHVMRDAWNRRTPERGRDEQREKAISDVIEDLAALADAADDVGVRHFDTDTMSPEVEAMRVATTSARLAIAAARAAEIKP